jgi:diacylglycerol O-acyltransferase
MDRSLERLSGLDASFLYLESAAQLMHVCGIVLVDPDTVVGGYSFGQLKSELGRRVEAIPAFRRKLKTVPLGIDHPVWVDDADFDVDRHVHRIAVPAPGGDAELAELCGHLASIPLDRSRPLWEMWVVEGLAGSGPEGNATVAVFTEMHHATVDGVSGANLFAFLCSLEPDAPLPDVGDDATVAAEPGSWELFGRGVLSNLAKPVDALRLVAPTTSLLTRTIRRARAGTAMAAPLTAPRTSFNGTISGRRSIAFTDIDLERIKQVKRRVEGATVNDVVLAVSGGALRRYLESRGELPAQSLLASVPVSVHDTSTRPGGTNKVSTIFARLGTDLADPRERLERLARSNANAKQHHQAIPADTLQDWAHFAAPRVFGLGVRMVSGLKLAERGPVIHNLVISNVPGPPVPLYVMGARIEAHYPLGPVFHGAGLNITVMSSNNGMHVGLIACRDAMPDPWQLAQHFAAELDALDRAV